MEIKVEIADDLVDSSTDQPSGNTPDTKGSVSSTSDMVNVSGAMAADSESAHARSRASSMQAVTVVADIKPRRNIYPRGRIKKPTKYITDINKHEGKPQDEPTRNNQSKYEEDIGEVWAEQARIRDEEEHLEREYLAAKEQTKKLKKKLKETSLEGDPLSIKGILGPEAHTVVEKVTNRVKKVSIDTSTRIKPKAKQLSRKLNNKVIYAGMIGMTILAVGFIWHTSRTKDTVSLNGKPLPQTIVQGASTKLFYPAIVPDGYVLDESTAVNESSFTAYTLRNEETQINITLTQQKNVPKDAFNQLVGSGNVSKFSTQNGDGYMFVENEKSGRGVIMIKDDVIYVNSSDMVDKNIIKLTIEGLRINPL